MSSSFDFDEVDAFVAGTQGAPGQRVFFLQVRSGSTIASFRLEKQQVAAMVESLERVLADLPDIDPADLDPELHEPVAAEWVVGQIGLGHDEVADRVVILLQEIELTDDEAPDPLGVDLGTARVHLTLAQATAFIAHAAEVVSSGRPLCPLCGRPQDPDGHVCPRTNGHKER